MADFFQTGQIVTLPRFRRSGLVDAREATLTDAARHRRLALVLPCLATDMRRPALGRMMDALRGAPYIDTLVVALDRATREEYEDALVYFSSLGFRTVIVWIDAPAIQMLCHDINVRTTLGPRGKGYAAWLAFGYLHAEKRVDAVALHDADVVNYDRSILTNLVYPVMVRDLSFDFSKAYYPRFGAALHGRVTRLLMRPVLQAFTDHLGNHAYIDYLSSFRYALSGEMCFHMDLLDHIRVPSDWGFEIGVMFEVLRHRSARHICQVDVTDQFDHKHQPITSTDDSGGLHRVVVDITKQLLRTLAASGVAISESHLRAIRVAYQRFAEDAISDSHAVASFNGLPFDQHEEEEAVETFGRAFAAGCEQFILDPLGAPPMPSWARIDSAMPIAGVRLLEVVAELRGRIELSNSPD